MWSRYVVDKKGDRNKVFQHKEWAQHPEPFPYQTSVRDIATLAPNYKDKFMNLTDLFPVGAHCFILATSLQYGCQAEVNKNECLYTCVNYCLRKVGKDFGRIVVHK